MPLFLPQSSSTVTPPGTFTATRSVPHTGHSSALNVLVDENPIVSMSTWSILPERAGSLPTSTRAASEASMPPTMERTAGFTPSMLQVGISSSSSDGKTQ